MEDLRRSEVHELARLTRRLNAAQQTFFQAEYGRHRRNPTTALLLCLLLGCFGAHYFYFGRLRAGVIRLLCFWTLVPLVTSLFEARTIASRAFRYNASLANELLLALDGTVDEQADHDAELAAGAQRATVTPATGRVAIAAPAAAPAVAPEAELAAAAWVSRDSAPDESASPLPPASQVAVGRAEAPASGSVSTPVGQAPLAEGNAASARAAATDDWVPYAPTHEPAYTNGNGANGNHHGLPFDAGWADVAATVADDSAPDATPDRPVEPPEVAWRPEAEAPSWWVRASAGRQEDGDLPQARAEGQADEQTDQLPWFVADARPALAAADAAATWSTQWSDDGSVSAPEPDAAPQAGAWPPLDALPEQPLSAHGTEFPALDPTAPTAATEREPVFMYEAAPVLHRDAVRLGPWPDQPDDAPGSADAPSAAAPDAPFADHLVERATPSGGSRQRVREDVELAALGSALAAGLADLLRDRPSRPRTIPLSRPLVDSTAPTHRVVIDSPPPAGDPFTPHGPSGYAGLGADGALEDAASSVLPPPQFTPTPRHDTAWTSPQLAWTPASDNTDWPAFPHPEQPADEFESPPGERPPDPSASSADGVQTSLRSAEAAAYVATPSQNLRRRVVQRVIVRKMAVVAGRVVAESTVERHVPVVADDEEMATRVRAATTDAAREALTHLMKQAPEDALPAIRLQLYALDSPAAVQHVRALKE